MSEEEKRSLKEDGIDWEDGESSELAYKTCKKDTNQKILENLMQNGLRDRMRTALAKACKAAREIIPRRTSFAVRIISNETG